MKFDNIVPMDKLIKISSPQIARAELVNPSVAIGIYDELSKSGYISRCYAGNQRILKETIDAALSDFSDKTKLKIVIAGANKSDGIRGREKRRINKLSRDTWKDISSIVNSFGFDERQIEFYNSKTNLVFDMYLDCKNGQIIVEEAKDITPYLNKVN